MCSLVIVAAPRHAHDSPPPTNSPAVATLPPAPPPNASPSAPRGLCPVNTFLPGSWFLPPQSEWPPYDCQQTYDKRNDCRLMMTDPNILKQWNWTDNNWRFRPRDCDLLKPSGHEQMREWLANRTVLFLGDSMSFNQLGDVTCEWRRALHGDLVYEITNLGSDFRLRLDMPPWVFDKKDKKVISVFEASRATIYWPGHKLVLMAARAGQYETASLEHLLPILVERWKLGPRDVVVVNKGLHGSSEECVLSTHLLALVPLGPRRLQADVRRALEYISSFKKKAEAPLFLWRETLPQHFAVPNGEFSSALLHTPCQPWLNPFPEENSWRNRITNPLAERFDIPILHLYTVARERWREHHDLYPEGYNDCTHYCVPSSVMGLANELLLHHIVQLRP